MHTIISRTSCLEKQVAKSTSVSLIIAPLTRRNDGFLTWSWDSRIQWHPVTVCEPSKSPREIERSPPSNPEFPRCLSSWAQEALIRGTRVAGPGPCEHHGSQHDHSLEMMAQAQKMMANMTPDQMVRARPPSPTADPRRIPPCSFPPTSSARGSPGLLIGTTRACTHPIPTSIPD